MAIAVTLSLQADAGESILPKAGMMSKMKKTCEVFESETFLWSNWELGASRIMPGEKWHTKTDKVGKPSVQEANGEKVC